MERGDRQTFGNSLSINNLSYANNSENKFVKMKKLISSIEKYLESRTEDEAIIINQHLQALSLSLDLSIFEPHTNIASKFFICIYDLMNILEPRSLTSWYCVDVLLNACKNASARQALMKTYQFLPCLARMVGDQLTTEKKSRLLRLIQDITCGIKIHWQIPHMNHLMSVLCKWIERQESEVVTLALGVLVNICYKNVISEYILQRNVDLKKFIRMCLALKGPIVEVHVCQIIIILKDVSGYIPAAIILNFVEKTFSAIVETFNKDSIVLKQVSEFFMECVKNNSSHLTGYNKYGENVDNILQLIESKENNDPECLSIILDFINFLIEMKVPQISSLYTKILSLALNWIQESIVSFQALTVLRTIAVYVDKKDNKILEPLIGSLKVFLLIFNSCKDDKMMNNTEFVKRLGALLQLMAAMVQVKSISTKITQELNEDIFTNIFCPLLGDNSPRSGEITCSADAVNMYIYALALVAKLVESNNIWLGLLKTLLGNRQIHVIIAQALCRSPCDIKKVALELSSSCSDGVAFALDNLQSMMNTGKDTNFSISQPHEMSFNLISVGQHERLENILDNVESLISKNEISNVATSELMELYNYKLSYLSQAERAALSSLEASTKHCTQLQHGLSRLTYENTRLQQSEIYNIQKLEEMGKKKDAIALEIKDLQNKYAAEKGKYKALHSQFEIKEKALEECKATLKDTEEKFVKLQQLFNKVQESCKRHEKNEAKKEEMLKNANERINSYEIQVKDLEKNLKETQKKLEETSSALQLKSAILDNITKMANSSQIS